MSSGWICLHRKIQDCMIWDNKEKFDCRSAWIDLLLLANHEDKKTIFDGAAVVVKRGQRITSIRKLAERWHWGIERTTKYLRLLESEGMIIKESDKRRTLLTIVNYSFYNDMPNTDQYTEPHTDPTQTTMINNENNILDIVESDLTTIKSIIDYLNAKTNKSFKATSDKTKKLMRARLKEGFTEDDFKRVIDNKCSEWLNDPKMNQYLRPETLFGTKFESYLNQKAVKPRIETHDDWDSDFMKSLINN